LHRLAEPHARGPGDRELVAHGRATGVIKRLAHGEYVEVHEPLDRARLHTLTAHERPGDLVGHEQRRRAVTGPDQE
ncbi:hypothetical protein ABT116_15965, partial [Streptomyces sp. NPDC002130]